MQLDEVLTAGVEQIELTFPALPVFVAALFQLAQDEAASGTLVVIEFTELAQLFQVADEASADFVL